MAEKPAPYDQQQLPLGPMPKRPKMESGPEIVRTPNRDEIEKTRRLIWDRMAYHPATPDSAVLFDEARSLMIMVANELVAFVPGGREQALMLTHLEEALMWASKAIAMQTPVATEGTGAVARVLPE